MQKLAAETSTPPTAAASSETPETVVQMTDVEKVTEIANAILSATGNMDIYQETFESIQFKVLFKLNFLKLKFHRDDF